jgi:hypothetical protein
MTSAATEVHDQGDADDAERESGDAAQAERLLQHRHRDQRRPQRHQAVDHRQVARRQRGRGPREAEERQHVVHQRDREVVAPVLAQADPLAPHPRHPGEEEERGEQRASRGDRRCAERRHGDAHEKVWQRPQGGEREPPGRG